MEYGDDESQKPRILLHDSFGLCLGEVSFTLSYFPVFLRTATMGWQLLTWFIVFLNEIEDSS